MSVADQLTFHKNAISPMDINPYTSDSPFHPMGTWNTLSDFKFEKVKYIPRDAIPFSTGGLVRVTIDAIPVKLFQMDLCVKISAIKTKNQINGVAETGTYWRTVRDYMYNMFEGYTIYNGNGDIETVDFDQRKWEHISHKDQSTHDGDDYMSKNSNDVTRQDYSASPQFMKLALHNFHTRATHNSIYLNKTANDYKIDISFIKGNCAYFFFQLRNVADVHHVRSPKYERYLPFAKARLLYSSGKEVYPSFEDMSENYSEMKKYFTLPAPYPNEKGFSRYNFGGYCWSLEPQNQHNKSGSLPTSGLNNLILEVTMKAITTQDIYIDVFFMSSQFIQQKGSKIQRVFTI
ncbi:hypothetical protein ACTFIR_012861 [Dictyostelium discoideum]